MPQGDPLLPPQDLTQAVRSVNKHLPLSSIPPAHPDEVFYIECHVDPETKKGFVLWDDILQAFEGSVHVRHKAKILPYAKDKDLRILEPRRIAAVPDAVLDVVVGGPLVIKEGSSLKDATTTTSAERRKTVNGLEQTAWNNSSHVDGPLAVLPVLGSQEVQVDQLQILENLSVSSRSDSGNKYQQRGLQSATADASLEEDLAQTTASATQGNNKVLVAMGDMYRDGKVTAQDYHSAFCWYIKAARQGDPVAQSRIGDLHYFGEGFPQDFAKALEWHTKAAEQGHIGAQYLVGFAYNMGRGVSQDYVRAMDWYLKAAEQGDILSQNNIGILYFTGQGVPQSYSKAAEWYQKAADQGHEDADDMLDDCKRMIAIGKDCC